MPGHHTLFTDGFLSGAFADEYAIFKKNMDVELRERLRHWNSRKSQKETSAEQNFIRCFFQDTWGYVSNGSRSQINDVVAAAFGLNKSDRAAIDADPRRAWG